MQLLCTVETIANRMRPYAEMSNKNSLQNMVWKYISVIIFILSCVVLLTYSLSLQSPPSSTSQHHIHLFIILAGICIGFVMIISYHNENMYEAAKYSLNLIEEIKINRQIMKDQIAERDETMSENGYIVAQNVYNNFVTARQNGFTGDFSEYINSIRTYGTDTNNSITALAILLHNTTNIDQDIQELNNLSNIDIEKFTNIVEQARRSNLTISNINDSLRSIYNDSNILGLQSNIITMLKSPTYFEDMKSILNVLHDLQIPINDLIQLLNYSKYFCNNYNVDENIISLLEKPINCNIRKVDIALHNGISLESLLNKINSYNRP